MLDLVILLFSCTSARTYETHSHTSDGHRTLTMHYQFPKAECSALSCAIDDDYCLGSRACLLTVSKRNIGLYAARKPATSWSNRDVSNQSTLRVHPAFNPINTLNLVLVSNFMSLFIQLLQPGHSLEVYTIQRRPPSYICVPIVDFLWLVNIYQSS